MRAFNIIEHPTLGGESASRRDYFTALGLASAVATIATTIVALRVNDTPIAAVFESFVRSH
ncbi:hypothetical protein C8Q72DRAFT_883263 [Fomitopsis betulina]|nr:hypothetical protein C8Q72DRAFT_883263 [Fomitopsis betulina]